MDAGNLLKPMLGRGELRCIGACAGWVGAAGLLGRGWRGGGSGVGRRSAAAGRGRTAGLATRMRAQRWARGLATRGGLFEDHAYGGDNDALRACPRVDPLFRLAAPPCPAFPRTHRTTAALIAGGKAGPPTPPSTGATTLDEYRKYIEKDPALERRFQQVRGHSRGRGGPAPHVCWCVGVCAPHGRMPWVGQCPFPGAHAPGAWCVLFITGV